jgi:hypothetical protein
VCAHEWLSIGRGDLYMGGDRRAPQDAEVGARERVPVEGAYAHMAES